MNGLATTLYELLADNLPTNAGRIALIDPERSVSYGALSGEVERLAARLAAAGVAPGDRVIVHCRKSISEAAAIFAVARCGAVVVNVNALWTPEQLAFVAADCDARLVLTEPALVRRRELAGNAWPPCLVIADCAPIAAGAPARTVLDTALAMIIYTSGSTGRPKGVMLSHHNLVAGARSVVRYLRLGPGDRLLSVLPYSFDYGLNQLTTMMLTGGSVVHQPVVMPAEIVASLGRHGVTGLAAVPPVWNQIVRLLDAHPVELPALRRVTNSGGRLPRNILEAMPRVFPGTEIVLMYGLTEAFRSTYLEPSRFAAKMGAIGRAVPGAEVYVVTPDGALAGAGEEGELVHRGPFVSLGYWGQPDVTAARIRPCPALSDLIGDEPVAWSGDTVRIDADGDLWFVGRRDAMIKTSGFRLSPDEVEDLVSQSGFVGDVVAYGEPDDDLGEVVHVAASPLGAVGAEAIIGHCRRVMPAYMVPRRVHLWALPMPRTASGKLARPEIIAASRAAAGT